MSKPFIGMIALLIGGVLPTQTSERTNKIAEEKSYIKEMCGCYKVDFEYAETFSDIEGYEYRDRYEAHGLEWIVADEEADNKVVIQHLLIVNDTMVIKHWRQDWLYENQDVLDYQHKLEWNKKKLSSEEAAGTWTQKVYQVDDSPRYQGHATWVNVDGKKYWESTTAAPLPRREYTQRNDYNVMMRNNKHKITNKGHVHELDNAKVVRTIKGDSTLVWEKGMNSYTKVDDAKCKAAQDWWKTNRIYWADVRTVWAEVIAEHEYINIKVKVDNKKLWQRLFGLGDELMANDDYNSALAQKTIRETIELHLSNKRSDWDMEPITAITTEE